jgi:hypothetical protein
MSLPYLKDLLVSLYEDVVISMKGMSSSPSPSYLLPCRALHRTGPPSHPPCLFPLCCRPFKNHRWCWAARFPHTPPQYLTLLLLLLMVYETDADRRPLLTDREGRRTPPLKPLPPLHQCHAVRVSTALMYLTRHHPQSLLEPSMKTAPSAGHRRTNGECATVLPRAHAHVVIAVYAHFRAGTLGRYWPLGQDGRARPWAKSGPRTIPHFSFLF